MHKKQNASSNTTAVLFVLAALASAMTVVAAAAGTDVGTGFSVGQPRLSALIVETVHPLTISQYSQPAPIVTVARRGTQGSPEDVLVEMISSMKAKDFAWNSSLWSSESLKQMQARDAARGKQPADWIKTWEKEAGLSYSLLHRIEYGKYVLIEYEAKNPAGKSAYKDTMALEKIGGKWFLTQALAADPVLMHWNAPGGRVQIAPDAVFDKR